jgi:hypothetical protein
VSKELAMPPAIVFSVKSVPFDRRMRNSQALFSIFGENPFNRVSNQLRPRASFQTQLPTYPAIQIIIYAETNDMSGIGAWQTPDLTSTDRQIRLFSLPTKQARKESTI